MYKEWTGCAILTVNTPLCLASTESKTCCAMLRGGEIIMQIRWGYQKKCLLGSKAAILSIRWKFHCIAKIIVVLFLDDLVILSLLTLFVA